MPTEPANPYAPAATSTAEPDFVPVSPGVATLVSFLGGAVLGGFGLLLLGYPRRFALWAAPATIGFAGGIAAALAGRPVLFFAGLGMAILAGLGGLIETTIRRPPRRPVLHPALAIAIVLVFGMGTSLVVRVKLLEAFQNPSGSMVPTLLVGDHFFIDKRRGGVERGDVVVFRYPRDPDIDYVKRVIAVGGDTVEFREAVAIVNGRALPQTPSSAPCPDAEEGDECALYEEAQGNRRYEIIRHPRGRFSAAPVPVPPGHLFLVGDNRDNSNDSRAFGTVSLEHVKGRARFLWWSSSPDGELRLDRVGRIVR
jgi:signal peptidase I